MQKTRPLETSYVDEEFLKNQMTALAESRNN